MKEIRLQKQEAQRTTNRINTKKHTYTKTHRKNPEASQGIGVYPATPTYMKSSITSCFSSKTIQARRQRRDKFKVLGWKPCQSRILYQGKYFSKVKEIKIFWDKQKLRECIISKPILQKVLKKVLQVEEL